MTEAEIDSIASSIAQAGLEGRSEPALVEGLCRRALAGGLPLARAIAIIDTLHPIHEGRAFRWERDKGKTRRKNTDQAMRASSPCAGAGSPLYRSWRSGDSPPRVRVTPESIAEFPTLAELSEGSIVDLFGNDQPLRPPTA